MEIVSMQARALVLSALLVVSLFAMAGIGSAGSTHVLDEADHLGTEAAAIEFAQEGETHMTSRAPDLTATAAAEAGTCGVTGTKVGPFEVGGPSDVRNDYLCLEYGEGIERTFIVYVTAGVWHAYSDPSVEAVGEDDATAAYDSVRIDGERYLEVEVTLDEPGRYVFPVNRERSWMMGRWDTNRDRIEDVSGVSVADDSRWQYVDATQFKNGSTHIVRAPNGTDDLLFEYRDGDATDEDAWREMPGHDRSDRPVYYNADSDEQAQIIVTNADNPPEVRYKEDATTGDRFGTALREIGDVLDDLWPFHVTPTGGLTG